MSHRSFAASRRLGIAVVAAALFLTTAATAAADPTGSQQQVSPAAGPENQDPSVAGGTDRALVVYENDPASGSTRIHGRFVDGSGTPIGAEFAISEADESSGDPDVAYNATRDEYLVVWEGLDAVDAQRVGADGGLRGENFSLGGGSRADDISVGWSATVDEYLAVWEDAGQIRGRRVTGAGAALGDTDTVLDFTSGGATEENENPDVAHDATTNRWLLTWDGGRDTSDVEDYGVYGQLLDATAEPEGDLIVIDVSGSYWLRALDPSVAANTPRGGFRVAFERFSRQFGKFAVRAAGRSESSEIFIRDVSADGETPEERLQVSMTRPGENADTPAAIDPQIARDPNADEFLVVWSEELAEDGNSESPEEIFGQRLAADGSQLGTDDAQISSAGSERTRAVEANHPGAAYVRASCSYAVGWEADTGRTGENVNRDLDEVFARGFDAPDCPAVQQTQQQQQQQQQAGTTLTTAPQQERLPVRCLSSRRFSLHLQRGKRRRITSARATLDGARIKVQMGKKVVRIGIDLRGKPEGTYTVRVRARRSDGQRISLTRRYRTCVPGALSRKPA